MACVLRAFLLLLTFPVFDAVATSIIPPRPPGPPPPSEWTIREAVSRSHVILVGTLMEPPSTSGTVAFEVHRVLKGRVPARTVISGIGKWTFQTHPHGIEEGATYLMFLWRTPDKSLRLLLARWHQSP